MKLYMFDTLRVCIQPLNGKEHDSIYRNNFLKKIRRLYQVQLSLDDWGNASIRVCR